MRYLPTVRGAHSIVLNCLRRHDRIVAKNANVLCYYTWDGIFNFDAYSWNVLVLMLFCLVTKELILMYQIGCTGKV